MALTSPGLIKAANDAIVGAANALNIAGEFCRDFSDEFVTPGLTTKVAVIPVGTASTFNATSNNYETGDQTTGYATIALNRHIKQTRAMPAFASIEAPNAPYWAKLAEAGGKAVAKGISDAIGGLITTTVGGTSVVCASATLANIGALRASCKDVADTVLALDGDYFTSLLVALGGTYGASAEALQGKILRNLFGFKSVIQLDGMATGVKGALIPSNAIAIAGRAVPINNPQVYVESGTVTDPASGLTLTIRRHGVGATDATYINVEALFGAAVVQGSEIKPIVASAPAAN